MVRAFLFTKLDIHHFHLHLFLPSHLPQKQLLYVPEIIKTIADFEPLWTARKLREEFIDEVRRKHTEIKISLMPRVLNSLMSGL